MAINETEVTGRKFRKLIDEANKLWQKISFWTKSSDVEFDDGKDAETKVGAIDGITDSLVSTSSNIAASAKAVSTINNNLGGFTPIIDDTGKITGYKTSVGGADTVFPFKSAIEITKIYTTSGAYSGTANYIFDTSARTKIKIEKLVLHTMSTETNQAKITLSDNKTNATLYTKSLSNKLLTDTYTNIEIDITNVDEIKIETYAHSTGSSSTKSYVQANNVIIE